MSECLPLGLELAQPRWLLAVAAGRGLGLAGLAPRATGRGAGVVLNHPALPLAAVTAPARAQPAPADAAARAGVRPAGAGAGAAA
jgi:hypothetical protein